MTYFLKKGDLIGVAAPSARFDHDLFDQGLNVLESMGFRVHVPSGVFEQHRYLAGTDRQRALVVNDLFRDPQVRALISVRGGYGAMRILPLLDWDMIGSSPKLYVGFSDASALIGQLISRPGALAVHGPNLVSLAQAGQRTLESFFKAVTGQLKFIDLDKDQVVVPGVASGILAGGNLATLAHMTGTRFHPVFKNRILFIEDVGEPSYKIDRMLCQMRMAGCFKGVRGVITGSFENCDYPAYIPQILEEVFGPLQIPVCTGLESGHGKVNISLPMGVGVELDADNARIRWLS